MATEVGRFTVDPPEEAAVCECRPCKQCDGEGGRDAYAPGRTAHDEAHLGFEQCWLCQGTGRDTSMCEVHEGDS